MPKTRILLFVTGSLVKIRYAHAPYKEMGLSFTVCPQAPLSQRVAELNFGEYEVVNTIYAAFDPNATY